MNRKTHDLCLAVGEYTAADGQKKKRYRTIGALMEGEHGPYVLLNAECLAMPLFALANRERRDQVPVSAFERDRTPADPAPPADDDIPY